MTIENKGDNCPNHNETEKLPAIHNRLALTDFLERFYNPGQRTPIKVYPASAFTSFPDARFSRPEIYYTDGVFVPADLARNIPHWKVYQIGSGYTKKLEEMVLVDATYVAWEGMKISQEPQRLQANLYLQTINRRNLDQRLYGRAKLIRGLRPIRIKIKGDID
jgi:hypothetical protein